MLSNTDSKFEGFSMEHMKKSSKIMSELQKRVVYENESDISVSKTRSSYSEETEHGDNNSEGDFTPERTAISHLLFPFSLQLFEGMKAYRGLDNRIRLFRPMENMNRMNNSAQRVSLPTFDGRELIECIKKLVSIDADWVPSTPGDTLYIRPTLIGTEPTLGVSPPNKALLFVIASPVGPYFPTGIKPVTLMADPRYVRSWPGGPGEYKIGSNYAPTLLPQVEAFQQNCQQVLWLFGEDHQLTEVGTMNLFIYWINDDGEKELITPPLNGLILPGVTRRSLLELARGWNEFKVSEKEVNMKKFLTALKEKRIIEVFGAGTACVVCPVERILFNEEKFALPTMDNGAELTNRFLSTLMDIQFGRVEHKWSEIVE
eukprot:XP_014784263.1 PREDICTED: branched-chain-amino-acid aminotransferase, cytosolic-like [Octopus bimaculoides]